MIVYKRKQNIMKNLFVLLSALFIFACTKPDILSTYDVKIGDSIVHNKELTVVVDSLWDSRCPTELVCVWEGQAEVFFSITLDENNKSNLSLIERVGRPELADTTLLGYHIKLIEVDPYPANEQIQPEEYTIRLLIEQE